MIFIWEKLDEQEFRIVDLIDFNTYSYNLSDLHKRLTGYNFRQKQLKGSEVKDRLDLMKITPLIEPQNRVYSVITYDELLNFYDLVKEYTNNTHFNSYIKHKFVRLREVEVMVENARKALENVAK